MKIESSVEAPNAMLAESEPNKETAKKKLEDGTI
jgi:hypothetical protein